MFWDKGYTPSQNIEALLDKENATVEEFLDEDDILQECKTQKKSIVNYFTRPDVIKRLIELITTEPPEELPMVQRFRHANMACEIMTLGLPSLDEKLLSDVDTLTTLYSYLEKEPPLNPLLSSFFSKTFNMLFKKKAEQDWFLYQQMCLQLLEFIKSQKNFLDLICKHFSTPIIPDLIMQMMKDVEGGQLKRNLYEWLTEDKLVERLIALLGNPQETDKHANVADFFCDLIQQGRSMRQNDQENDSFEPAFDGSNPILKTIESGETIEALLNVILEPNAQESAIVSGISVVLTLIKPVVFADEPNSDRLKYIHKREKEIHEKILTTVIHAIVPHLKEFNQLLRNPPKKSDIVTTSATLSPPFGMTRLHICSLFTVLLQTKNDEVAKAICETDFFNTLFSFFKQYCWNNLLHNEVEKCIQTIFAIEPVNISYSTQGSTILNDPHNDGDELRAIFDLLFKNFDMNITGGSGEGEGNNVTQINSAAKVENAENTENTENIGKTENTENTEKPEDAVETETTEITESIDNAKTTEKAETIDHAEKAETAEKMDDETSQNGNAITENGKSNDGDSNKENFLIKDGDGDSNDKVTNQVTVNPQPKENDVKESVEIASNTAKIRTDSGPSVLQTHVIVNCQLISKLIDCWQHNKDSEAAERGRRLGYMGHLIKILKHISNCISESEHIGALIASNLSDASELALWQSIINPNDGDFTKALSIQNKMLANVNAHEACDFTQHLSKDFLNDDSSWDFVTSDNGIFSESNTNFGRNLDDDEEDEDESNDNLGLFSKTSSTSGALQLINLNVRRAVNDSIWPTFDDSLNEMIFDTPFDTSDFADFDAHFNNFTNDLGDGMGKMAKQNSNSERQTADVGVTAHKKEEYDNNANVEKSTTTSMTDNLGMEAGAVSKNSEMDEVDLEFVRNLQERIHNLTFDFEDDEGMWTKPLGQAALNQNTTDVNTMVNDNKAEVPNQTAISNGPASVHNEKTENNFEIDIAANPLTHAALESDDIKSQLPNQIESENNDDSTLNSISVVQNLDEEVPGDELTKKCSNTTLNPTPTDPVEIPLTPTS